MAINAYNNNPVVWNLQSGSFPSITSQLQTPLDWQFGIMWNISLPLPVTTNAAGANANSTWSILGSDGNYVILDSAASSYRGNGIQYFEMAGVNVANQPVTTTYTIGRGGNVQNPTVGTLAWANNITEPVQTKRSSCMAQLFETAETFFLATQTLCQSLTGAKAQDSSYGHVPPSIMTSKHKTCKPQAQLPTEWNIWPAWTDTCTLLT